MLPLLLACTASPGESGTDVSGDGGVVIEVQPMQQENVFAVEWTPATDARSAWVEFGQDDRYDHRVEGRVDGGVARVTLYGLRAGHAWQVRGATTDAAGDVAYTETTDVQAADVPDTLPDVEVLTPAATEAADAGFVITATMVDGHPGAAILARDGGYVWWTVMPQGYNIFEALMSADGEWVEWVAWNTPNTDAGLYRRRIDGTDEQFFPVPGATHGFHRLDDGSTWALMVDEDHDVEGLHVRGNRLVEVDGRDGATTTVWSTWDDLVYDPTGRVETDAGYVDWTHMNSCDYDPATGKYWVSLRELDLIAQVDRASHKLDWTLGGSDSDFTLLDGRGFAGQHSPLRVDGGLVLFDNGEADGGSSRGVRYDVDEEARTYTQTWSYEPIWSSYTPTRGNVDPLDDGGALLGWGAVGEVLQLDAQDDVVWELDLAPGGVGVTHAVSSLGGASR